MLQYTSYVHYGAGHIVSIIQVNTETTEIRNTIIRIYRVKSRVHINMHHVTQLSKRNDYLM